MKIILLLTFIPVLLIGQVDWKHQTTAFVTVPVTGTPLTPSSYLWNEELADIKQGIHINLTPTEIVDIYVEQNNAKINFGHLISDGVPSSFLLSLEVSVNNGAFESLYTGSSVANVLWDCQSVFTDIGEYNLKVNYRIAGNNSLFHREYNIKVVENSSKLFKDNFGNTMRMWAGDGTSNKPIILSPGFDAYNTKPEQYYRFAGKSLINCLTSNDHDVYIVWFKFNPQDLRRNAAVYSSAIQFISADNNGEDVIATGISMGGLISRYALTKAEHDGTPLPVSKWISLDAPHQGANIPNAFQNFLNVEIDSGSFEAYGLQNAAAKTLLEYNTYDTNGILRNDFVSELNSLNSSTAYPQLIPKIGVSFSSTDPNPNSVGEQWIEVDAPGDHAFEAPHANLTFLDVRPGSFLPRLNKDPFIGINLGIWVTVNTNQFLDPTFIPHASSLDLDSSGNSPFDEQIIPSVTGFHDVIPDELVFSLLNAILFGKSIFFQDEIFVSAYEVHVEDKIEAGRAIRTSIPEGDVIIDASGDVIFKAGKTILLNEGFIVKSSFLARIELPQLVDCDTGGFSSDDTKNFSIFNESGNDYNKVISIYPNPVSDFLTIENCHSVKIYDTKGQLFLNLEQLDTKQKIDISSWPRGLYVCLLNGEEVPVKIIKI